jgi:prevent-host-death family protein
MQNQNNWVANEQSDSMRCDTIKQVIMTCLECKHMITVNITEVKSRLSEYLSRAAGGERFVIVRRSRPLAAIISAGELERLDRAAEITRRLAQTLGQSPALLEEIEQGKVHPAMAAFGLWKDEEDLLDLDKRVLQNRLRAGSRPNVDL